MALTEQDYAKLVKWASGNYQVLSIRWHNHPKTRANWGRSKTPVAVDYALFNEEIRLCQ